MRQYGDSVLLILGGGVCMDIAKTIAFGVKQSWEYLTHQAQPDTMEHLPVGTIPTIPSSGSDMDGATQITNDKTAEQAGLADVYPNFMWLNPAYIAKLPVKALIQGQMTSFVQVSIAYVGLERSGIAEAMALASPVYFYTWTSLMKRMLDRTFAMEPVRHRRNST